MQVNADNFVKLSSLACQKKLAQNTDVELKWRIAFLAWGAMHKNRHANFAPGELAEQLGVTAPALSKGIARAKKLGLITGESSSRCLVSPPDLVTGWYGSENTPCAVCEGRRLRRAS